MEDNNILEDDFDFDSDDPVEEAEPAEKTSEATEQEQPPGPRPPRLPPKARRGLLAGVAALAAVAALVTLAWAAATQIMWLQERRAMGYVETLLAELPEHGALALWGDVVVIDVDEDDGRAGYVFIPHRATGAFGQPRREIAVFRNGVHIGNVDDEREGPIHTLTEEQMERAQHRLYARRCLRSFHRLREQAQQENRRMQADPAWRSFRVFSAERIAQRLGLEWREA